MKFLFLTFLIFLSSCASVLNQSQKLTHKIDNELKKNYAIDNGYLVALYGLYKAKTNNIYEKDYGQIINDEHYNNLFLSKNKAKFKNTKLLEKVTKIKVQRVKNLVIKLNHKYNFLSSYDKNIIFKALDENLEKLDKIVSQIPVMLPESGIITSKYGMRKCPINKKKKRKMHCGIDIQGLKSNPIYASADGVITLIKRMNGYGNVIEIRHSKNFKTRYAHLNKIYVHENQKIIRGTKIATQGNTGKATAEHLHYEIWYDGKHINPYEFISHSMQ